MDIGQYCRILRQLHSSQFLSPVGQSGRICPVSEARSAVRRPARGGRKPIPWLGVAGSEPTPWLGVAGSEPTPWLGVARGRGASPVRGEP